MRGSKDLTKGLRSKRGSESEGHPGQGAPFGFGVAGIEASMAHKLHPFGWDVLHDKRDEIQSREGDIPTQTGGCFFIPKAQEMRLTHSSMRTFPQGGQKLVLQEKGTIPSS